MLATLHPLSIEAVTDIATGADPDAAEVQEFGQSICAKFAQAAPRPSIKALIAYVYDGVAGLPGIRAMLEKGYTLTDVHRYFQEEGVQCSQEMFRRYVRQVEQERGILQPSKSKVLELPKSVLKSMASGLLGATVATATAIQSVGAAPIAATVAPTAIPTAAIQTEEVAPRPKTNQAAKFQAKQEREKVKQEKQQEKVQAKTQNQREFAVDSATKPEVFVETSAPTTPVTKPAPAAPASAQAAPSSNPSQPKRIRLKDVKYTGTLLDYYKPEPTYDSKGRAQLFTQGQDLDELIAQQEKEFNERAGLS